MLGATAGFLWWGHRRGDSARVVAHAVALATVGAMALARVFGESGAYARSGHFEPVYHPTVQVMLGKTILVDMTSQYGLYPHLVAPIASALGGGVLAFTLVMAALVGLCLAGVWTFLAGATENKAVALVGFLAFVGGGSLTLFQPRINDLYFQYMPIRVIFPVASTWLAWRYLRAPSRRAYAATTAFLGLGPLWNLDAGVPALAAWVATLGYLDLAAPGRGLRSRLVRLAGHAAAGAAAFGAALVLYAAFAVARSGRLPDFAGLVVFQSRFYASGFYMLPMPLVGGWLLVAMVYLAALGLAAQGARRSSRDAPIRHGVPPRGPRHRVVRLLSGSEPPERPHARLVARGAPVDARAGRDRLRRARALPRASRLAWASAIAAALAGPAWSLAWAPGFLGDWYARNLATAIRPSPHAAEIELLRRSVRLGERVLIVSLHESRLNAALREPSAWPCSVVESLLVADFRAMAARIERGEFTYLYVDDSFQVPFLRDHVGLPELARFVNAGTTVASTVHGRLVRPRLDEPPPGPGTQLYARFDGGVTEGKLAVPPVMLGPRFTLEAVVRPDGSQAPLATVLGDLPGLKPPHASGFALQQAGPDGNAYALFAGDGRAFQPLAEFRLEPGRWTHVAIAVGGGVSATYLDGRLVASRPVPEPVPIAPTSLPVVVGNWRDRDRPFRGLIAEIRVAAEVLTADEVARHGSSAARGLEALAGGASGVPR